MPKKKKTAKTPKYRLVAIDSGRQYAFAIAKDLYPAPVDDPANVILVTGEKTRFADEWNKSKGKMEKRYETGAKTLIAHLKRELAKFKDPDEILLIMIEEPIGTMPHALKSLMADVGSVIYAFDSLRQKDPEDPANLNNVALCKPADWKVNLRLSGLIPMMKGNISASDKTKIESKTDLDGGEEIVSKVFVAGYLPQIRERFNRPDWNQDQAAAFSMLQLNYAQAGPLIEKIETDRKKVRKTRKKKVK